MCFQIIVAPILFLSIEGGKKNNNTSSVFCDILSRQSVQPKCLPLSERERARTSLMSSKARQEVWRAKERTLLHRSASTPAGHSPTALPQVPHAAFQSKLEVIIFQMKFPTSDTKHQQKTWLTVTN